MFDIFSEYKLTCDKIREWSKLDQLPHPCPAPAGVTDRQFTISIPKIPGVLKATGSVSMTRSKSLVVLFITFWSAPFMEID